MTTIFHQVPLNNLIRDRQMTEKVMDVINLLDKALTKMPKVPANTQYYRGITLSGDELTAFIQKHQKGKIVEYPEYTFTANNRKDAFIDMSGKNIKITIVAKENSNGRTIWDLSFGKTNLKTSDEAIFIRGSKFEVNKLEPIGNDIFEIELLER